MVSNFSVRKIPARSIFVASDTKRRPRSKAHKVHVKTPEKQEEEDHLSKWAKQDSERYRLAQEQEFKQKLRDIKNLTSSVQRMIQKKDDERKQQELVKNIPMPSDMEREVETIHRSLSEPFDPTQSSLLTPVIDLPPVVQERLGLSVKFLVSKEHQNWGLVLETLRTAGGFKDMTVDDVTSFIQCIPKHHIPAIRPQIREMMKQAGKKPTPPMLNIFIESLSVGGEISPKNLQVIEGFVNRIKGMRSGKLPTSTMELLVNVYGKVGRLDKINELLAEMKTRGVKPSPWIYTNILKTLVYKLRDHKQAVSIFDSMSFLSQETKPGTEAYKDVIVSYINNDDVEKALDLYQEMLKSRTPVNQETLVALARGCTSRKQLRFKAWEFMFEIHDNGWTPSLETLEYMIYLSGKDGDLALARALYKQLAHQNHVTPRSFNFLMLAYSKTNFQPNEFPAITAHERGRNFRANILSRAELVTPKGEADVKTSVPMLPMTDLASVNEVLAESSAVWAHAMLFNPQYVSPDAYNSYLNIAAIFGTYEDLSKRYELSKLADDVPTKNTRIIIEEPEQKDSVREEQEHPSSSLDSPLFDNVPDLVNKTNITRTTLTYMIALKGAGRLKKYEFSQEVWKERGLYRKSKEFKLLLRKEKDKFDFMFANQMVQSLTQMDLLDDALAIIISTEYQFKWSWAQLSTVYNACVNIGHDKHCSTLRSIANRAQIRFEGKIRKKDYREYAMKRGY